MSGHSRRSWWVVAILLAFVVSSCSGPSPRPVVPAPLPTNRLSVQIDLSTTHVVAGRPINGHLSIYNPHAAINVKGCAPSVAIVLGRGSFSNGTLFFQVCSLRPLVPPHGLTRLPTTVSTRYTLCASDGGSSVDDPKCLPSGGAPPLPTGTYRATIEWSGPVPLPNPPPVTVVLT
jgi:hypothetical protein